jgi:serine/threonine protein kinase
MSLFSFCWSIVLVKNFNLGNLSEMMQRLTNEKNCLTDLQILKIIFQISSGLKSLHGNKYAHRDIRPENILYTYDGTFKIGDFGSASRQFYDSVNNSV